MQKISPFLWFPNQAEEAARFYVSLFKNARITDTVRYGDAGPGPKGEVMWVSFELEGQTFHALNGNPSFPFTPATSFFIGCETQAELDGLWDKLLAQGGKPMNCGWITDHFGVCWQVVPTVLGRYVRDENPAKAKAVMQAMMGMVKFDIAAIEAAYRSA